MAVRLLPERSTKAKPSDTDSLQTSEQPAVAVTPGRRRRRAAVVLLVLCVPAVAALAALLMYVDVRRQGGPIVARVADAPPMPVAIVFGAGITRHGLSSILYDRVAVGVALYKAGKARKLLMTGDNSEPSHNEPEAMRQAARQMGVPDRDIVLDYAGFRTFDSLYRARDVFGVQRALLVSQAYHLPRACYIARTLGLDVVGVPADGRDYGSAMLRYEAREVLSVENAWLQANLSHPRPTFLGKKQPIFP